MIDAISLSQAEICNCSLLAGCFQGTGWDGKVVWLGGWQAARDQNSLLRQVITNLPYLFSHEIARASRGPQWIYGKAKGREDEFPVGGCFHYELLPPVPAQGELLLEKIKLQNCRLERSSSPLPANEITAPVLTTVCLICLQTSPVMEATLPPGNLFLPCPFV